MFRRFVAPDSQLYDQNSFYKSFEQDLRRSHKQILIESPFITKRRFLTLLPLIQRSVKYGSTVIINTRNPDEHEPRMREQALDCVNILQHLGVRVLYTTNLHRKIAVLDDITWEGSLNILSQADSCEMMRRTQSPKYAQQLMAFIHMAEWYNQG